eukprot:Hpha_TRINITY_DN16377_c2_g1::TRINITY_DN16377_c2_g1_i1::g.58108::m.58108
MSAAAAASESSAPCRQKYGRIAAPGLDEWRKEVQTRQQERCVSMPPEERERFLEVRKKREGARKAAMKAKCLSRTSEMATRAFCSGQRGGGGYESRDDQARRAVASCQHMERIQQAQTIALERNEEDAEEALDVLEREIGEVNVATGVAADIDTEQDAQAVLETFRKEPADDAACAEKSKVFETYFATIEKLRRDIEGFWAESNEHFEGKSKAECERLMKKTLDSPEAMGVHDREDVWVLYLMLRQCQRNEVSMRGLLKSLQSKLELLSSQDECPVCLDALEDADEVTTLGCCHKVCTSCYKYWSQMQSQAFCPLCRHHDFLDAVGAGQ